MVYQKLSSLGAFFKRVFNEHGILLMSVVMYQVGRIAFVKTLPVVIYTLIAFSGHPWVYCQQMKVETRISKNVILFC